MSSVQQQVESASKEYSSKFTKGDLALPPAKKYLVLTCMDARIDPAAAFGIELGDAHVIRNVCNFPPHLCRQHAGLATDTSFCTVGRCIRRRRSPQHYNLRAIARYPRDRAREAYRVWDVNVQE